MKEGKRLVEGELDRVFELAEISLITPAVIHDIRNYLSAIKANAQIGKKMSEDERAKDRFEKIEQICNELDRMIESFRKLYKGHRVSDESCDVRKVLEFSLNLLKEKFSGIEIENDIQSFRVRGDEVLLRQVFLNLISNSADAVKNSQLKLIRIRTKDKGNKVAVFVEDSGCGIPDDIRSKIFEPLFTTKKEGTGLGLYIVKRILERIGGKISLVVPDDDRIKTSFCVELEKVRG